MLLVDILRFVGFVFWGWTLVQAFIIIVKVFLERNRGRFLIHSSVLWLLLWGEIFHTWGATIVFNHWVDHRIATWRTPLLAVGGIIGAIGTYRVIELLRKRQGLMIARERYMTVRAAEGEHE